MNELYHYNHNHDKLGRFARSIGGASRAAGSSILSIGKKKNKLPEADIKKGKAANTKLADDERNRLVKSGTREEITANKDRLSNQELKAAIERLESDKTMRESLEQRLSTLNGEDVQATADAGKEKVDKLIETASKLENYKDIGMKAWNIAAGLHNAQAAEDDKWPTFNKDGTAKANGPTMDAYDLMTKGSASDILANKDKLTKDQLQEAIARRQYYDQLEGMAAKENAAKAQADAEKKRFKEKDKDSRTADYLYKNAENMSTDDLKRAVKDYEDRQGQVKYRQELIDKLKDYRYEEAVERNEANERQERRDKIRVDYWFDNLDYDYKVVNGKVFKRRK